MKHTKTYYPDGSFYVTVEEFSDSFTFFLNSYEDLWELNQILDVYKYTNENKPLVTIPCLLDAQADRRFEYNQPHGLKLVLNFLNSMYANFQFFHPHNSEVVEVALDNVNIIDNSNFVEKVLFDLTNNTYNYSEDDLSSKLILFSSDSGGFKPLMKLCGKLKWEGETFSASKSRKYVDGKSKLIQEIDRADFEAKDILIIDDICVKGGTFTGLAKMLRERNVGKLYLAVSHLTLETVSEDLIKSFDKIYTTDSKGFKEYKVLNSSNSGHDRAYSLVAENVKVIKMFGN